MINSIESQPNSDDIEQVGYETSIQSLPAEILNYIFSFLPHCSLIAAERVCRPWKAITQYNWKKLCSTKLQQDFTVIKEDMDTNWKARFMKFSAHSANHFLKTQQNTQLQFVPNVPIVLKSDLVKGCLNIYKYNESNGKKILIYRKDGVSFHLQSDKSVYFASNLAKGGRLRLYKYDLDREVEVSTNYQMMGINRFSAAKGEYVMGAHTIVRNKRKFDQQPKKILEHKLIHFAEDSVSEIMSFVSYSSTVCSPVRCVLKKNKVFYQNYIESNLVVYDIEKSRIYLLFKGMDFSIGSSYLFVLENLDCTDNCCIISSSNIDKNPVMILRKYKIQFFDQTRYLAFKAGDYQRFSDWIVLKVRCPITRAYQKRAYHEAVFHKLIKYWPEQRLSELTSCHYITAFDKCLSHFDITSPCYYIFQNVLCEYFSSRNEIHIRYLPTAKPTVAKIVTLPKIEHHIEATKFQRSKDKKSLFMIWTIRMAGVSKSYRARIL